MDLSFPRFDRERELAVLPADLAVLMVGVAARQAGSATAGLQARGAYRTADDRLFQPVDGAFNGAVAGAVAAWRKE